MFMKCNQTNGLRIWALWGLPDVSWHDVDHHKIDLLAGVGSPSPPVTMLHSHIVATEPWTAGGFHLHPPQMLLRPHHKVVSRAVPIGLGNHKPHAARLEREGQLRDLPATLGMEIHTLHPARPKFSPQLKISSCHWTKQKK